MKIQTLLATTAVLIGPSITVPAAAQMPWQKNPKATYIVFSNNEGFTPDTEERGLMGRAFHKAVSREISEKKTSGRGRQIKVLLTTYSTNVIFSGTAKELERQGARVLAEVDTFSNRCNDLVRTYQNIQSDVENSGYKSIRVVHIGKFVDSPAPCKGKTQVNTPQAIREELGLAELLDDMTYAEFTAVALHPDQYQPLFDYLNDEGVIGKKRYVVELLRIDETHSYADAATAGGEK